MKLQELFLKMQDEFINCWGEYQKLNDELDLYRGKELSEENNKEVNRLVVGIQEKFLEMRPVIIYVMQNYSPFNKASANYNRFIEDIKSAGATEEIKSDA